MVTDFLDGELSNHDLDVFEAHLEHCEGCRVFVDQIRMTVILIASSGHHHVEVMPANFADLQTELARRSSQAT